MKILIKIAAFLTLIMISKAGFAQCESHGCDPQLTGFGFNVECIDLNGTAILSMGWFLGGGDPSCTAPPNSWRIQVSMPLTGEYGSMGVSDVNGPGFDWVYSDVNKTFLGTNNIQMNWLAGGTITFTVRGLLVNNCVVKLTQANIGIVPLFQSGCPQAFNNQIANDALAAGKGVQNPLPVVLSDFTVVKAECLQNKISWTTLTERNSSLFELERSENGYIFETIYKVAAVNKSVGGNYTFTDTNISESKQYYYRLKQVDLDGKNEFFQKISSPPHNCLGSLKGFSLYPNPAFDKVYVSLSGFPENEYVKLVITNALGETISTIAKASPTYPNEVKLNNLPAGIYNVKIEGAEDLGSKRFIKVD
jgi:hypothetical protein